MAVIDQTLPDVKDGDKSLIEFNEDFIQKHRTSLPHVMIGEYRGYVSKSEWVVCLHDPSPPP